MSLGRVLVALLNALDLMSDPEKPYTDGNDAIRRNMISELRSTSRTRPKWVH
ncbi:hypothetical protein BN2156_02285 [Mycolicibacterium neworleansense]|uniref:Uncharacterized protein n=1 Tax=Mycolicibacterium neworleansense TaxID=146018 RepID=A0A0H5RMP1_9MYCO|nr:hypothetical protein BN2156_02285 [Mycolicibacterium neworleansense]